MKSGIYIIKNIITNKVYVGSAVSIKERFYRHKKDLRKGKHHSILLQRSWDKYGENNFDFIILEYVKEKIHLLSVEQVFLDYYKSYDPQYGYNICKNAGSQLGVLCKKEVRQKISDSLKGKKNHFFGKKHTEETKEKLRKVNLGKTLSQETRKKISDSLKGEKSPNYGKKFSEETKRKIGEASSKRRHSDETKERMRKKRLGKKQDQKIRNKIGDSNRGKGKGYSFIKETGKYRASIVIERKRHHLGYFSSEEEAREAFLFALNNIDYYKGRAE